MKPLIFVSPVKYSDLFQRHQAFARLLAKKGFKVFFVEPFTSEGLAFNSEKLQPELSIIRLKLPFLAREYAFFQNLATRIALKLLFKRLKLKTDKTVLWIAEPSAACFADMPFSLKIYDRCDRHGFFPGQRESTWNYYESRLFNKADYILVSHRSLLQDIPSGIRPQTSIIGNATGFEMSNRSCSEPKGKSLIEVLSSGAHFEWIDFEWLNMLASHPDIKLHIAGIGRGKGFSRLIKNSRVHFHKKLNSEQLLQLSLKCDAGVIPFKDSKLTEAVDPVKAYDFAACGLRIWAPDIKGLKNNELIDDVFYDLEGLNKAITRFGDYRPKRGRIPTWNERLERVLDITGLPG